ncbi:MAG: winged helix-turn-helix domain-containing protein [Rhodoglobus sp.]
MTESVSAAQARRIALAAQGFGRPHAQVGTRQLNQVIRRLGVLQLDSVNVFERSHYLPVFARLGPYDKSLLDQLTFSRRSGYTEAWAHQAAIIPVESWPLWRWAMDARRQPTSHWGRWAEAHAPMLNFLRSELATAGPLTARSVEHESNVRTGPWWGWSDVKTGLECLFMFGEVVTAGRVRFERVYALAEQRLPAEIINRTIPKHDAVRELVRRGAQALGIGTVRDIADYWRLPQATTRVAINELVDSGDLVPVTVGTPRTAGSGTAHTRTSTKSSGGPSPSRDGAWGIAAFLHRDARIPRRIEHAALLSPFDPVVWERARALRMFDFHYRIEIYTPASQRIFGYYSLPLLIDEAIVGRIDLKTDRQSRTLLVQSAWRQPGAFIDLERVTALLRDTATWQGMEGIKVMGRGDLSPELSAALTTP